MFLSVIHQRFRSLGDSVTFFMLGTLGSDSSFFVSSVLADIFRVVWVFSGSFFLLPPFGRRCPQGY